MSCETSEGPAEVSATPAISQKHWGGGFLVIGSDSNTLLDASV